MNEEKIIKKLSGYDDFKCIADSCKFTCCEGWDIDIDKDTYEKWKNNKEHSKYLLNNVKVREVNGEKLYFINKDTFEACSFLDCKGLCNIVKCKGEEYLSKTCSTFPRISNEFEYRKELSLSCSCPEVMEILDNIDSEIIINQLEKINKEDIPLELKLRDTLINIMYEEGFSLEEKLLLGFEMLLNILENESYTSEDIFLDELEKYSNIEYIKEVIYLYNEIKINKGESLEEVNSLFLDIIENYKSISNLKCVLERVSDFAENTNINLLSEKWEKYKESFKEFEDLLKKCIISKIFSNCTSDDMEDMIISFQLIILEYLLTRYSVFLNYCINDEKIQREEIKNNIITFSRVIENNKDAVIEFLYDGCEEIILELGYLCFISLV
ncbi:flagellin lysine-N-methylase [Clostridium perfringens]|uniref:flagellin lysine-N-methylase n=1 Tax=Clostridium perfringens TaxID=1502 RepID=UPI001E4EC4E8|nr:flagellin lysine-N-methylase [Clostridium perfringens]MCC5429646.1 flagellin lysine-N-methylase [Clostridium perfringens]